VGALSRAALALQWSGALAAIAAGGISAWLQGWSAGGIASAEVAVWALAFLIQARQLRRARRHWVWREATACPGCARPGVPLTRVWRVCCMHDDCRVITWAPVKTPLEVAADMERTGWA
jgi:hypothetical protein